MEKLNIELNSHKNICKRVQKGTSISSNKCCGQDKIYMFLLIELQYDTMKKIKYARLYTKKLWRFYDKNKYTKDI